MSEAGRFAQPGPDARGDGPAHATKRAPAVHPTTALTVSRRLRPRNDEPRGRARRMGARGRALRARARGKRLASVGTASRRAAMRLTAGTLGVMLAGIVWTTPPGADDLTS